MVTFSAIRDAAVMFLRGCRVLPYYCGVLTQYGSQDMRWNDAWFWTKEEATRWCYKEACDYPDMTTGHVCKATLRVGIENGCATQDVDTVYKWTLPSVEWRTITA